MNPQKYIDELNEIAVSKDVECAHARADSVLCEALIELGHEEIVLAWGEVERWYA